MEPITTEIEGKEYSYLPMGAGKARELLTLLTGAIGPVWADALDGLKNVNLDGDAGTDKLLETLQTLSGSLAGLLRGFSKGFSHAFYKKVTDDVLARVCLLEDDRQQNLTPSVREQMFATSLLTELKIVSWALSVQFADFFELLAKAKNFAVSAIVPVSKSVSRPEQTGSFSE